MDTTCGRGVVISRWSPPLTLLTLLVWHDLARFSDGERTGSSPAYDLIMGALRPWHLLILACPVVVCVAVVSLVVWLVVHSNKRRG